MSSARRKEGGRRAQAAGKAFEDGWCKAQHDAALWLGIVAGPVEHNEPQAQVIHGRVQYTKRGVSDFQGILWNGHGSIYAAEAKSREEELLWDEIEPAQRSYLDAAVRGGGMGFLLLQIRGLQEDRVLPMQFAIPWQETPWTRVRRTAQVVNAEVAAPWRVLPSETCFLAKYCPWRNKPPVPAPGQMVPGRKIFPSE